MKWFYKTTLRTRSTGDGGVRLDVKSPLMIHVLVQVPILLACYFSANLWLFPLSLFIGSFVIFVYSERSSRGLDFEATAMTVRYYGGLRRIRIASDDISFVRVQPDAAFSHENGDPGIVIAHTGGDLVVFKGLSIETRTRAAVFIRDSLAGDLRPQEVREAARLSGAMSKMGELTPLLINIR